MAKASAGDRNGRARGTEWDTADLVAGPALTVLQARTLEALAVGPAYFVRDRWRFRGSQRTGQNAVLLGLVELGLACLWQDGEHTEVRISEIGRKTLRALRSPARGAAAFLKSGQHARL
jgi:hypothetical protein